MKFKMDRIKKYDLSHVYKEIKEDIKQKVKRAYDSK